MDAFRVSPLGGRITATNVVISTSDYTVLILRMNLTWRYWLLRLSRVPEYVLESSDDLPTENSGLSSEQNKKLSTSTQLLMDGVEVFVYNRTPAYDNIVETLLKDNKTPDKEGLRYRFSSDSVPSNTTSSPSSGPKDSADSSASEVDAPPPDGALKFLLNVLPLQIRIKRGAVVVGNPTTPSILIASFKSAVSILDVCKSPCILDNYRVRYEINMEKFQVSLKPNISYDPLRYMEDQEQPAVKRTTSKKERHQRFNRIQKTFKRVFRQRKQDDSQYHNAQWRGLRRYLDDTEDERIRELGTIEEYAKYSLIVDSVSTQLIYFYDVPGLIPPGLQNLRHNTSPPEFGVDVIFSMATIHHGSWADRQRGAIQNMLFPPLSRDSEPTVLSTAPGTLRRYAGFNLRIFAKDEIIVRIPTREFSKDKEVLTHQVVKGQQKITRPFGWIELKVGRHTKITSFTSYLANPDGWPNSLNCYFAEPEIRSSVNHDILFTADEHRVECDVGFPLKWNGECIWKFKHTSKNGRLFFLREHAFLLTDMFSDFASGPPTPYENYRPFQYQFHWKIENYKLFFNVNDHNIINNALDFNSNKYICFSGDVLDVSAIIPLRGSFAKSTTIDFSIKTTSLDATLEVPPWHTVSAFMTGSKQMGKADAFEVTGSYTYYNAIEVSCSNLFVINAIGDNVSLIFYGYLIRYLFTFRENYFGDYKHFKTFEEYTDGLNTAANGEDAETSSTLSVEEDPEYWKMIKAENDLNILFTFVVRNGLIVLPCQLYDHTNHIGITFDYLDVDIHICHYYMDLQADFGTGFGHHFTGDGLHSPDIIFNLKEYKKLLVDKDPTITIDGFSVHTHRMFGLLPDLLTYYCKWDFSSGSIIIDGYPRCLTALKCAISNFTLGFKDLENTLIYKIPIIYDAANFTFRCPEFIIRLKTGTPNSMFVVELSDLLVSFNDMANHRYSSKIVVSVPSIVAKVVNEESNTHSVYWETSFTLTNICQKVKQSEHRRLQQKHVRQSDAPTHRTPFLVFPENKDEVYMTALGSQFPSVSLPHASVPLTKEYSDIMGSREKSANQHEESSSDSSLNDSEDEDKINPTTNYYDELFCPQTAPRPNYKNDTFIFEFENMDVFVSPSGISEMAGLIDGFQILDLDFLIDFLQVQTIKGLRMLIFPVSMIDNIRFVCPEIRLRLAAEEVESPSQVLCSLPQVPVLSVNIQEPSIALSKVASRIRNGAKLDSEVSSTVAFHVKEIYVAAHEPHYFYPAFTFMANDLEGWRVQDANGDQTASVSLDTVKSNTESTHLKWLINFAKVLSEKFSTASQKLGVAMKSNEAWRRELIYMLTAAARDFNLEFDPGVLTKPSSILRACDDHVRFYESWKLITKIRYILCCLPKSNFESENKRFKAKQWRNPPDALTQVIDLFTLWRSWEGNTTERAAYFKAMFGEGEDVKDARKKMSFNLNQAEVSLNHMGDKPDNFVVHNFVTHFHSSTGWSQDVASDPSESGAVSNTGIFLNVDVLDGFISEIMLRSLKLIQDICNSETANSPLTKSLTDSHEAEVKQSKDMKWLFLLLNLKVVHLKIGLPLTFFELHTYDNVSACQIGSNIRGQDFWNVASNAKEYSFGFGKQDLQHVNLTLNDLKILSSSLGEVKSGPKVLDVDLEKIDLKMLYHDDTLCSSIRDFLKDDLKLLVLVTPVTSDTQKEVVGPNKPPFSLGELPDLKANFRVSKIHSAVELLHPLRFQSVHSHNNMSIEICDQVIDFDSSYKQIVFDMGILDSAMLRLENSNFDLRTKVAKLGDLWMVSSDVNLGYLKISNSLIVNAMDTTFKHKSKIIDRIEEIKAIFALDLPKKDFPKANTEPPMSPKVAFNINLAHEYIGISAHKEVCRYTIEFEGLTLAMSNIAKSSRVEEQVSMVPIWGELGVSTTRISVWDPLIAVGLSTLLDVNFSVKISNDNITMSDGPLQSLQVESQYFRICLSPLVLFKMIELADSITKVLNKNDVLHKQTYANAMTTDSTEDSYLKFPKFSSVHVLSYNCCVGWLFGTSHKDYPGIIAGTERFFAVAKADMGKLTLMEGYLSVANGFTSFSFYSTLSEMNNLNRAFMPKMQLNYCVTEDQEMWITLKGDELDVRFMSNSIIIVERAVNSGSEVQTYFGKRSKDAERGRKLAAKLQKVVPAEPQIPRKPFTPKFSSMQCTITFAGSRVLFYRLHEEDMHDSPPSLSLQSPAVLIGFYYKLMKEQIKKHNVRLEVLMSPSDNTLYSSCVPVVMDFLDASKQILRTKKPEKEAVPPVHEAPVTEVISSEGNPSSVGASIANILHDVDFHLGIIVEKQRLSLSCEPTAKVAAVVEYDGASILASTALEDPTSIYCIAHLNSISASLQHIYSDDRSGSFEIKSIMFSNMISFNPSISVVSSGCISDVSGYVKMKQYQDLDLFKDIWYPKSYQFSSPEPLLPSPTTTPKFKKVSSTYAVPLSLTYIVSNFALEVDFGAALGVVNLDLDRAWAVTRKTSDWYYDVKLGLQSVAIGSDGRLGGYMRLDQAFLHSAIEWKLEDMLLLEIPLVMFAAGFEKFQMKTAFDDHVFAIANIEKWTMDVFNRKRGINISKDHLYVITKYCTAEIFLTSLAASDFYDIYSTISRMIEEKKTSYKEILKDSNKEHLIKDEVPSREILEVVKKLETKIEVITGSTRFQVYPQSFDDTRVLVVELDKSKANFLQNEYTMGVSNEIELQFNNLKASLSTPMGITLDQVKSYGVDEFVEYARKAKGGNIFVLPKFMISMRTFQKYDTNIVEYLYQSSFGGTVDIKWNLGSVNCVREMYAAHKRAFLSRTDLSNREVPVLKDGFEMKEKIFGEGVEHPTDEIDPFSSPHKDFDNDIQETFEKVANSSKFTYVALAPPVIEAPQLKELGSATPPLEWFGLHRNRFPDATHHFAIVTLQKLIHEIDQRYTKTLGKA